MSTSGHAPLLTPIPGGVPDSQERIALVSLVYNGGAGNDHLAGGSGDDFLSGEADNDTLFGDAGADTLTGQGGDDVLMGGIENDVLHGDHDTLNPALHGHDVLHGDEGADQLLGHGGSDALYGGADNDILYGDGPNLAAAYHGNDALDGGDGDDFLWGDGGDDALFGGPGNDQLVGGTGVDTLEGGRGHDVLAGDTQDQVLVHAGDGVDTILRDPANPLTAIILGGGIDAEALQFAQAVGTDGSQFLTLILSATDQVLIQHGLLDLGQAYTLGGTTLTQRDLMAYATVSFSITGSNRDDTIYGGQGNDIMNANEGNDLLDGGTGHDNLRGHAGNDTLIGAAGDDQLHGFEGADVVDGGSGNDALYGGAGNDTYRFGRGAGADSIDDRDATAGTIDTIFLATDVTPGAVSLHRHGNDLILSIDESPTQLTVLNHFVETTLLNGIPISDYFLVEQLAFADGTVWNKAAIAQRAIVLGPPSAMVGGPGNDTFVVDNTLDTVTESPNQGTDTIHSGVSYTLPAHVENLTLTGYLNLSATGNALDNVLTGNRGHNVLDGGSGADTLSGGAGDDRYTVDGDDAVIEVANEGIDWVTSSALYRLPEQVENGSLRVSVFHGPTPALWSNALDNVLLGHASAATYLDGDAGADTMTGGQAGDTYVVDDYGDTVIEEGFSGTDTVRSAISYTLGARLENLLLTGSESTNGTGNDLANVLTGNSANNTLTGDAGNDTLDGGMGADTLLGEDGDDRYVVDETGDSVTENANAGMDTVLSSITYTLGANVEYLTLSGTAAMNGTGNSLANLLTGNSGKNTLTSKAGNDTLDGAGGNDTLHGGAGNDVYRFGPGGGKDTISENDATADNSDRVELSSNPLSLIFSRPGDTSNLRLALHGSSDTLTVQSWYNSASNQTEVFQAADGSTLLHTQVEQLIQAMATFSANHGGMSWAQAIEERPDDVRAILTAYWQPVS